MTVRLDPEYSGSASPSDDWHGSGLQTRECPSNSADPDDTLDSGSDDALESGDDSDSRLDDAEVEY